MIIQDGQGGGYSAGVTSEKRLKVNSVTEPNFLHQNAGHNRGYVWNFPSYNSADADTVMFIRNDSSNDLRIHHVYIYSDAATVITLHTISAGETPAGTAVTGVNLNRNSSDEADATAKQDETGNSSQGTVLHTEYVAAAGALTMLKEDGYEIVLGKNDCIAVDVATGSTAVTFGHIVGYYDY